MGKLYTQEFYFLPSHKCNLPPWSLLMHLPSIVKPLKFDFCLYFKEAYVSYFQWFCSFFFREWDTREMEGPHRMRTRCMWAAGDEQCAWLTSRPHANRSGRKAGQPPCSSTPVPRLPQVLSPSTHCSEALPLSGSHEPKTLHKPPASSAMALPQPSFPLRCQDCASVSAQCLIISKDSIIAQTEGSRIYTYLQELSCVEACSWVII